MRLETIKVLDFKNIGEASLRFSPKLNCLVGNNGMGKSNMLDAIYYLSFGKSFSGAGDRMLVRDGSEFAMLTADYRRRDEATTLNVAFWAGEKRKSFRRDGKEYKRLSAHIGMFPAVLVAPSDLGLVNGTGEERRRFIDQSIAQSDPIYLDRLMRYATALTQRNSMLRNGVTDPLLYEAVESVMAECAAHITETRRRHVAELEKVHTRFYNDIDESGPESTGLRYVSAGGDRLADEFGRNRQRDMILKHTTAGPHRDDIEFTLNGMPLRRTASQGQQKTFTIALRFAQYLFTREASAVSPLLLLDDIFDKLDSNRVRAIINVVRTTDFGQIFITDTNRQNLHRMLEDLGDDIAVWNVDGGRFNPISLR